ncbi:CLUMA_CG000161, isoform A [Clunio marinus]|uniref:Tetraspanin n=1 Tax=Clunio marinus TaxID=568069 RepID=A0A1J1HF35_9DIPT|nr:CLUMA_CG000161, isoform A [Clunio marinus]
MVKADSRGASAARLARNIACVKYTLFCFNIVAWLIGLGLFAFSVWIRVEPGFEEWISILNIYAYYIGVYILIGVSVLVLITSFLGCCSALMEHGVALILFTITQIICFLLAICGTAILLEFSTYGSRIQPMIRHTMNRLIMTSEYQPWSGMLSLIQESVGCCGADGPNDYITLRQPLPIECRDTVTGHAFSNGCVDELTWYLEDKSIWAAAMAMSLALIHVVNAVLGIVLMQALRREEKVMYRR